MSGFLDKLKVTFESITEGNAYTSVKTLVETIKETELNIVYLKGMLEELKKDKSEIGQDLYQKKLRELDDLLNKKKSLESELRKIKELIKYV